MAIGGNVIGEVAVKVKPDVGGFQDETRSRIIGPLKAVGALAGAGLAVGLAAGVKAISTGVGRASDLNETVSKTRNVFGQASKSVEQFAQGAASKLGATRNEALTAASNYGNLAVSLGVTQKAAAGMSTRLVKLATDQASLNNLQVGDVQEKFRAALVGEFEPIRTLGIALDAQKVAQEAVNLGLAKSTKEVSGAAKVQATYALILKGSKTSQGDFAETSAQLANQQKIAGAQTRELSTTIGSLFLPGVLKVTRAITSTLLPSLQSLATEHGPRVKKVLTGIGDTLAKGIKGADIGALVGKGLAKLEQVGPKVEAVIGRLSARFAEVRTNVKPASDDVDRFSTVLNLSGAILDVVGRNLDNVIRFLPALAAGFIAYKAAQAAANVAALVGLPVQVAQVGATIAHASAVRSLAASQVGLAGSTAATTAVQAGLGTAAKAGTVALLRQAAASVAARVAAIAGAVATGAMTAAQWLLNAALTANPIGLVVVAIALLVGGLILAYKKSATFRAIVQAAFRGVQLVGGQMVSILIKGFRFLLMIWLTVAGGIVKGAATAFGWVPGIGPKLKAAAAKFDGFKATVLGALESTADKASGWGRTTGNNYAAGLIAATGRVHASVHSLVGSVDANLRPGSPTKEGPLSKAGGTEGWGRRLGENFARGLAASAGVVGSAAGLLGGRTAPGVSVPRRQVAPAPVAASAAGGAGVTQNFTLVQQPGQSAPAFVQAAMFAARTQLRPAG